MTRLALALALVAGCKNTDVSQTDDGPTWYGTVQPIVRANCEGCHSAGRTDRPDLSTYETARPWADLMAVDVQTGRMPFFPPDPDGCAQLNTPQLPQSAIDAISDWAEAGAPEGNPADGTDPGDPWDPTVWDLPLEMAGEYVPTDGIDDENVCFVLDPGLTTDAFVTAMEVVPGNLSIVHHALLYTDPTGAADALVTDPSSRSYECEGGTGVPGNVFGGWVPGLGGTELPAGTGFRIPAGSKIVMQLHYHPEADRGSPDRTRLGLTLASEPVDEMIMEPYRPAQLDIPAGAAAHEEAVEIDVPTGASVDLWAMAPHMHLLGSSVRMDLLPASGDSTCLIDIPEWDFEDQRLYWMPEPVELNGGDAVRLSCVYDNSTDNPENPSNPPVDVQWGEGTFDEMCIAYVAYTMR